MFMVVKSDKQLKYLATNKDTNSLRVLLFDDNITEPIAAISDQVPTEYATCPLDHVLLNVTTNSRDLVWLKLPSTDAALVTDGTVAHMQPLPCLRVLQCMWCRELTELDVTGHTVAVSKPICMLQAH
jgi:hypothetical protein